MENSGNIGNHMVSWKSCLKSTHWTLGKMQHPGTKHLRACSHAVDANYPKRSSTENVTLWKSQLAVEFLILNDLKSVQNRSEFMFS